MPDSIKPFSPDYYEFLRDESRMAGCADSISFPANEDDIVSQLRAEAAEGRIITTQGARTGITAGSVPCGGHILNLGRMNAIGDAYGHSVTVGPGALLSDIRQSIEGQGLFFPPDPTEASASIGGMVACNASGALTFHYGSTRDWVESVRMVLADGDVIKINRGQVHANGRMFSITTQGGRVISGSLPSYTMPSVKSAAGYYAADDMDLIDLLIGMEGTLGIITEIGLRLIDAPKAINGLTVFLPSEKDALRAVCILREGSSPVAIEFFNSDALNLLRKMKPRGGAFEKIPALKPEFHSAIYAEFHGNDDEQVEEAVLGAMESLADLGVSDEDTWYATSEREMAPLKAFRHAIPEAANLLIDERKQACPELTKLGTDMSVPDECLESVMEIYNRDLAASGLESVIFGHIGNNHVHVNILPNSLDEYAQGKAIYLSWAKRIVEMGGSVSAEHGIGKLKAPFLELMYGADGIEQMRKLKALFDPDMILNPGNLFPKE